jgi:hypothetical protein
MQEIGSEYVTNINRLSPMKCAAGAKAFQGLQGFKYDQFNEIKTLNNRDIQTYIEFYIK